MTSGRKDRPYPPTATVAERYNLRKTFRRALQEESRADMNEQRSQNPQVDSARGELLEGTASPLSSSMHRGIGASPLAPPFQPIITPDPQLAQAITVMSQLLVQQKQQSEEREKKFMEMFKKSDEKRLEQEEKKMEQQRSRDAKQDRERKRREEAAAVPNMQPMKHGQDLEDFFEIFELKHDAKGHAEKGMGRQRSTSFVRAT